MNERQEEQGELLLYVETWPDTPQINQRIRWASDVVKWRGGFLIVETKVGLVNLAAAAVKVISN